MPATWYTRMEFHTITMTDQQWVNEILAEDGRNACENTFANNYLWRNVYQVEVAKVHGCVVFRYREQGMVRFSFPIGNGDIREAIREMKEHCEKENYVLCMSPLVEKDVSLLEKYYPGHFFIREDRNGFDYIYTNEKLVRLPGKKLQAKRNHIARFKDDTDWSYEPITESNLPDVRKMALLWKEEREEKWDEDMEQELKIVFEALDHLQELELVGGCLRQDGEVVAFSIGEKLNHNTFVVHFEKAFPLVAGAYPMMNQQFVIHECEGYDYINREDDTGNPGLRKAKLSYQPDILLKKYIAKESDVVFADPMRDKEAIFHIWKQCFHDEEDLIRLFLEQRMTSQQILVLFRDGRAVSMAALLPVKLHTEAVEEMEPANDVESDAFYVYAVATLPEYQGQGFSSRILEFAKTQWDCPLILCPADDKLKDFYERFGFLEVFPEMKREIPFRDMDAEDLTFEAVTPESYKRLRDETFKSPGYVEWDENAIAFAMAWNEYGGGQTVKVSNPNGVAGVLMYTIQNRTMLVTETTLPDSLLQAAAATMYHSDEIDSAFCELPCGMMWRGELQEPHWENPYLNLVLD